MNPKDIVRQGYDRISYQYRDDDGLGPAQPGQPEGRPDYEAWFGLSRCRGTPGRSLAAHDLRITWLGSRPHLRPASASQGDSYTLKISRACRLVPAAQFECADMSSLEFPSHSFAAVVSFYAIIHVPLDEQPAILNNIHRWLKPGGYLLTTVGSSAWTGTETDWHGAPMFWSHADRATYVTWLEETGFEVLWTRFIPEGSGGHTLVLARRLEL